MVKKKGIFLVVFILIVILAGASYFLFFSDNNILSKESFSVKTFLLKINIPAGGEYTSAVKIENNGNLQKEFNIYLSNLENVASLSDDKITIGSNEEKEISLYFKDDGLDIGVYPGELVISDKKQTQRIPVVVTVEDTKKLFSIIYSEIPKYQDVYPGGKLGLEIKVYDLDDTKLNTINSRFYIQDLNGEVLWNNEEDLVIEGSKTQIIDIPENWPNAYYVFVTSIDYKGIKSISSYVFNLSEEEDSLSFLNIDLFTIIIFVFVAVTFILIIYAFYERHKLLYRLKKQHRLQLVSFEKNIQDKTEKLVANAKDEKQKKKILEEFGDAKRKVIGELKKQQKEQIKKLKSLKEKKSEYQEKKLQEWKKDGYSKALKSANISRGLKNKLAVLKTAFDEGFIKEESYKKGVSKINLANKKLRRNVYK